MISDTIAITAHNCLPVDRTVTSSFNNYIIKAMEIKGSGEQLLIFLWILGAKSTQAIIVEGLHHYCRHWMYG